MNYRKLSNPVTLLLMAAGLLGVSRCIIPPPTACSPDDPVTTIGLQRVAEGLVAPVGLVAPPDGSGRIFILDQIGLIYVISASGERLAEPFLDISDRMPSIGIEFGEGIVFDERGLVGLAFHPNYSENGRFFIFYTARKDEDDPEDFDSENHVSEFRVSADDPNQADPDSERLLVEIDKPQFNHNGGQLAFGPDGYLYIGVGDGGMANDEGVGHTDGLGNGQDKSTLLGKILRIDVDNGDPYGIPPDNPFIDEEGSRPEIFALGLRNPWRFSFDGEERLFVADVGQDLYEEVDIVTRGGNYGWRIREGLHCFSVETPDTPPADCPTVDADGAPLIDPILEYPHSAATRPFGISITGGFVYTGDDVPCLQGEYVFGDWSTNFTEPDGSVFAARERGDGTWEMRDLAVAGREDGRIGRFVTSFGVDADGRLYVLTSENLGPTGTTGEVYRIVAAD